jgi:hypothetical protein
MIHIDYTHRNKTHLIIVEGSICRVNLLETWMFNFEQADGDPSPFFLGSTLCTSTRGKERAWRWWPGRRWLCAQWPRRRETSARRTCLSCRRTSPRWTMPSAPLRRPSRTSANVSMIYNFLLLLMLYLQYDDNPIISGYSYML